MKRSLQTFEKRAHELDEKDSLKGFRGRFVLPEGKIYFCSNSLGLPAAVAHTAMQQQMERWSDLGVEGWFQGKKNWYTSLDRDMRGPLAHLLGAMRDEVIVMNSLTVNLHLLLVSFYRPTKSRFKILIEGPTFPSDLYAIKSHIRYHGLDPDSALILIEPPPGEALLQESHIEKILLQEGSSIALVFLSSVNFLTGQVIDMESIARLAHEQGCLVGCDVAHAAGNIALHLHAWGVDFAVGCSYKYLCSGPGGPGIAFVHGLHHEEKLPRFSGWWGNDPETRFQMQLQPEFIPHDGAYSWQVSTPSILAMTPLVAALELFEEAGIELLRKKSEKQTAFLLELLEQIPSQNFTIITPKEPKKRGCQLSLLIHGDHAMSSLGDLEKRGCVCDFRPPNIIRVAPSPLYNTFHEIYEFACRFAEAVMQES